MVAPKSGVVSFRLMPLVFMAIASRWKMTWKFLLNFVCFSVVVVEAGDGRESATQRTVRST